MTPPLKTFLYLLLALTAYRLSDHLWTIAQDVHAATLACHSVAGNPDPHCTPGKVFKNVTAKDVCTKGYAHKVRNVSLTTKRTVYRWYGLTYPQPWHTFVTDHLIALSLGGSNSSKNLFPQPYL